MNSVELEALLQRCAERRGLTVTDLRRQIELLAASRRWSFSRVLLNVAFQDRDPVLIEKLREGWVMTEEEAQRIGCTAEELLTAYLRMEEGLHPQPRWLH